MDKGTVGDSPKCRTESDSTERLRKYNLIKIVDLLHVSNFPLQILPVGESEWETANTGSKSVIERRNRSHKSADKTS